MNGGRPLRFLGVVLGGWILLRIALLMPDAGPIPAIVEELAPSAVAATRAPLAHRLRTRPAPPDARHALSPKPIVAVHVAPSPIAARDEHGDRRPSPLPAPAALPTIPPPLAPTPIARPPARLAGSAWLLARGGSSGTLSGGRLGASQAGVRLTYAIGDARRVALTGRIATPLQGKGREAALGIEWKPTRLPLRVIAEQRFVLDGGKGGPTVGVIGGYGPTDVARGVRIEAYGQAGAIARGGIEGFIDTAARVTHPVATIGGSRVDLGIGAWGSAQRGAARFDLGPSLGVGLPLANRSLRLTLDWRQRVGGTAHPGSGPALSIGSDF